MIAAQDCVTSALRTLLHNQPLSTGKVRLAWEVTVGRSLARVTRASLSAEGVLAVQVTDPHWAREIYRSTGLITSRLNRLLGDGAVKRLDVATHAPR